MCLILGRGAKFLSAYQLNQDPKQQKIIITNKTKTNKKKEEVRKKKEKEKKRPLGSFQFFKPEHSQLYSFQRPKGQRLM